MKPWFAQVAMVLASLVVSSGTAVSRTADASTRYSVGVTVLISAARSGDEATSDRLRGQVQRLLESELRKHNDLIVSEDHPDYRLQVGIIDVESFGLGAAYSLSVEAFEEEDRYRFCSLGCQGGCNLAPVSQNDFLSRNRYERALVFSSHQITAKSQLHAECGTIVTDFVERVVSQRRNLENQWKRLEEQVLRKMQSIQE